MFETAIYPIDAPVFATDRDGSPSVPSSGLTRGGLTLLELIVVLVILSIVATAAVQALQPRVDNARLQQTRATLTEVQVATLGRVADRQPDGTPLLQGFVADVGCLPRSAPGDLSDATGDPLAELWNPNSRLAASFPYQFRAGPKQPKDFSDVQLACGWRGPYLMLDLGATRIRDGWGNPFQLATTQTAVDRLDWVSPLDSEQTLSLDLAAARTTLAGNLSSEQPVSQPVDVFLLVPDPRVSLDQLVVLPDEDPQNQSFLFRDVPIGVRALVIDSQQQRLVKYIAVPQGGTTLVVDMRSMLDPPPANPVPLAETGEAAESD